MSAHGLAGWERQADGWFQTLCQCGDTFRWPTRDGAFESHKHHAQEHTVSTDHLAQAAARIRAEQAPDNSGHGHVVPRADGSRMRCGGPGRCATCSAEAVRFPSWPVLGRLLALEVEQLRAQVQAVRSLHRPVDIEPSDTICGECSNLMPNGRYLPLVDWPCPTIRALDGEVPGDQ